MKSSKFVLEKLCEQSDGRIFDTYIRCQGKEPESIEEAKKHIKNCGRCQCHLERLLIAEEKGLYISE
ncbi:MAG TPA: hypothetical protein PK119_02425 [Candidatus Paceibacterota bacterium]|nr:hypothetical protein [Candidatus Paceibacterota bacterium]